MQNLVEKGNDSSAGERTLHPQIICVDYVLGVGTVSSELGQ